MKNYIDMEKILKELSKDRPIFVSDKEGKEASSGTKKGYENSIHLKAKYTMNWEKYTDIDDTKAGKFVYLLNKIER